MASTYSGLKTEIATFAMRTGDTEFENQTGTFISLAESRLNIELPLRVMFTDTTLTGSVGSRSLALPSDYVEPEALWLTTYGEFEKLRDSVSGSMPLSGSNGVPAAWCINGTNIQLDTPCNEAHTFSFRYRKSFALSDAEPTNWLLTNHPDVYLAACLVWGGVFMRSPEEAAPWKQLLEETIAAIAWKESQSARGVATVDPALAAVGTFNIQTG